MIMTIFLTTIALMVVIVSFILGIFIGENKIATEQEKTIQNFQKELNSFKSFLSLYEYRLKDLYKPLSDIYHRLIIKTFK